MRPDRRQFIKDTICAAMGGVSVFSALGQMKLLEAATSNYSFSDYKALVCVFLYGGNDSFNAVVPISGLARTGYDATRPTSGSGIGLAANSLIKLNAPTGVGTLGSPNSISGDASIYGLHPSMSSLATVFNGGHAAIVANVGTLVAPTTQSQFSNGSIALPPQLFSHSDQTAYWQSSPPSNSPISGWGGRIADLVASTNPAGLPILTGVNGGDAFTRGENVSSYVMNSNSATTVNFLEWSHAGNGDGLCDPTGAWNNTIKGEVAAFCNLQASKAQANALERTYASTMQHSIATAGVINTAVAAKDFTSFFKDAKGQTTGYDLDTQLQTVAQLIYAANNNVAGYTGLKRQVFFVSTGGYDTHSDELAQHGTTSNPGIFELLSRSLAGFYNALNSVGLASKATAFTCSDFGRTLTPNNGGTDHGWGSHHFVVGGAVAGNKFYGNGCKFSSATNYGTIMPSLSNPSTTWNVPSPNKNDSGDGYGRIIPTTSVDQYAATLAHWFGLSGTDINLVFPNLGHFNNAANYLGFLGA
ncbi:MAG TPA: DUF1501 domain-containing protein [Rudaea sp.]|jgi:uncharacterized protein (DUF1501 family)|nr:DUF1501 domain-containing protein [Rudaea sp.]